MKTVLIAQVERILLRERGRNRKIEQFTCFVLITRNCDQSKHGEECTVHKSKEKCIHNFGRKTSMKETTWENCA